MVLLGLFLLIGCEKTECYKCTRIETTIYNIEFPSYLVASVTNFTICEDPEEYESLNNMTWTVTNNPIFIKNSFMANILIFKGLGRF